MEAWQRHQASADGILPFTICECYCALQLNYALCSHFQPYHLLPRGSVSPHSGIAKIPSLRSDILSSESTHKLHACAPPRPLTSAHHTSVAATAVQISLVIARELVLAKQLALEGKRE